MHNKHHTESSSSLAIILPRLSAPGQLPSDLRFQAIDLRRHPRYARCSALKASPLGTAKRLTYQMELSENGVHPISPNKYQ